jgi:peptidyl-prolyl cis-trans isomerase A (cyclophilin A)
MEGGCHHAFDDVSRRAAPGVIWRGLWSGDKLKALRAEERGETTDMNGGLTRRGILAAAGASFSWPALAQAALPRVTLATGAGPIELALDADRAPISAANFLAYVDQKRLDGASFYRALKLAPDLSQGLIQGGVQGDPAKVLPPIAHEPTSQTGLKHINGTISFARDAPGTATCDFFICIGDQPSLDADPSQSGDNLGFAAFGRVTAGMDVVKRILGSPDSATKGEGAMKGEMLDPTVPILTARRA